jgi:glycogen phosphorylase
MLNGYLRRELPPELAVLAELAMDMRWTTSQLTRGIWQRLDPDAWELTENPYLMLLNISRSQLEKAKRDQTLLDSLARWRRKVAQYESNPTWFESTRTKDSPRRVAYFSMEFGLSEALPIYSGGLGMLAGDHIKTASDLGVPLIGVGILYQQGYFHQVLADDGTQREAFPFNDPGSLPVSPLIGDDGSWKRVPLELPGRTLFLRIWQAKVGRVPLYLLDSNDPFNSPWDRSITASLYDAGHDKRLLQEIVLGVGGWRLLEDLAQEVDVCHLNEGHAAFAVLARAAGFAKQWGIPIPVAFRATRSGNVFTTHTPDSAAFDEFDPEIVAHYAHPIMKRIDLRVDRLLALGRANPDDSREPFNMAFLAMRGSCHTNAVSQLHGRVSRRLFSRLFPAWPETQVPIRAITNGVHVATWNSAEARKLWIETGGGEDEWLQDLESAGRAMANVDPLELWTLRTHARQKLIEYVRRRLCRQLAVRGAGPAEIREAAHVLDPNALTLGFARRFTEYKRPNLMLRDPDRLECLLRDVNRPVQLIVAGKAHPNDAHGKRTVQDFASFATRPRLRSRVVFLQDYDMTLAQRLAAGIDVWLNTPRRPAEACGTSGMKVIVNGGLHLSVRDGWWDEAWSDEVGWQIGDGFEDDAAQRDAREAEALYRLLEADVIPEFYDRDESGIPRNWLRRVRASLSLLTAQSSSDRMVKDYVEQMYLPAARSFRLRTSDGGAAAGELYEWNLHLAENWRVHFGDVHFVESGDRWAFTVNVCLGELSPDAVRVELFADGSGNERPTVIAMQRRGSIPGAVNGFQFVAETPRDRPAEHFTPRVVPWHPVAFIPQEAVQIAWQR